MSPAAMNAKLTELLAAIPPGRVVTLATLACYIGTPERALRRVLETIAAAGGAIGRGPLSAEHTWRLQAEGVLVSPAGIVQDMARIMLADLTHGGLTEAARQAAAPLPPPGQRSRGMKDRP